MSTTNKSRLSPGEIWTVSRLTRRIRSVLEFEVGELWVEGEISNLRRQTSGHSYFTLKDAGAQLSCVLFRGNAARMRCDLQDGAKVRLFGEITVYEARGQYQLVVSQGEAAGAGDLHARFEALKETLRAEGLFEEGRKKRLPEFPACLALVTSSTGAVLQDMLRILERRAPWVRILLYPVRVQGEGAWRESARALERLEQWEEEGWPKPDVIVLARGGGSLEDLWNYNEEGLARAMARCPLPVVSAVGHETDFTIADFVADLRAPTPSAAAELIVPDGAQLRALCERQARLLRQRAERRLRGWEDRLAWFVRDSRLGEPERRLREWAQRVDDAGDNLWRAATARLIKEGARMARMAGFLRLLDPSRRLGERAKRTEGLARGLERGLARAMVERERRLRAAADRLRALGPEATLARGFSMVRDAQGRVVRAADQVAPGDALRVDLAKGWLEARVEQVEQGGKGLH